MILVQLAAAHGTVETIIQVWKYAVGIDITNGWVQFANNAKHLSF